MRRLLAAFLVCSALSSQAFAEFRWAPFLNAELYAGQSIFSGDTVNGLNGSLVFVPGMRFGDRFSLLPNLSLGYQKSRDVQELAGGGFLTQETQEHIGSLKGIYVLSPGWKGKLYASYKQELLKETKDEDWGEGLFDNEKIAAGLELETETLGFESLRLGLDYYLTKFPNFQSLSSKYLGAEVNAGTDVLDFRALDASLGGDVSLGGASAVSSYLLASQRSFSDQKIIKLNGTYSDDLRHDLYLYGSAGYRYQLPDLAILRVNMESLAGLDASFARLDSNQNNYDTNASTPVFNENYYDYNEFSVGPRLNLRFKEKLTVGLSFLYTWRDYADRPNQAVDGAYKSGAITNRTTTFRWSLGYPLFKGMSAQMQGALQHADSSMDYETVYRYNYSSSHYFAGLAYQF